MKRMMSWLLAGVLSGGIAWLGMAGCGGKDEEPYVYNCGDVCRDYGECAVELGASVDVPQCVASCEAQAATMADFESALEICQNCIWDGATCMEEVACASTCAGLVPMVMP